jgi:hypothetical protein
VAEFLFRLELEGGTPAMASCGVEGPGGFPGAIGGGPPAPPDDGGRLAPAGLLPDPRSAHPRVEGTPARLTPPNGTRRAQFGTA